MAVLRIITFGDPILKEPCREVAEITGKTRRLADDLVETMYHASGLGLAANQTGVVERIFVFDLGEGPRVCINPRIIFESPELLEEEEGCLSLPGVQILVARPQVVEIEYTDLEGKTRRLRGEGLMARLFRHELDHLDGRLLLERAGREERVRALRQMQDAAGD
jgi:peptide deformylase